jgi:hypothetical protein
VAWQPPSGGSRPVPIGSRFIGVSLQPAIPRRVAPQQSPLPLHRSPTIVVNPDPARQSNVLLNLTARMQSRPRLHGWVRQPFGQIPDVVYFDGTHPSASAAPVRWARSSRDAVSRWSCPPPTGVSSLLCATGDISTLRRHSAVPFPRCVRLAYFPALQPGRALISVRERIGG